jgi:hypothetical protein
MFHESTSEDSDHSQNIEIVEARQEVKEVEWADDLFTSTDVLESILRKVKLPYKQLRVIDLTKEGRTVVEIAFLFFVAFGKSVTEANIRQLKSRAIKQIRRYVEDELV